MDKSIKDDPQTLIGSLRRLAGANEIATSPFFAALKNGTLNDQQLKLFFVDYYEIVKASYKMLASALVQIPTNNLPLIKYVMKFLETEAGGHVSHLEYYHIWVEEFGVSVDDLNGNKPSTAALKFSEVMMGIYSSGGATRILAAQLATEDSAEVLINSLSEGFFAKKMSHRAKAYLYSHLLLENDESGHSAWARDALCQSDCLEDNLALIEETMIQVTAAFKGVFDGYMEERIAA